MKSQLNNKKGSKINGKVAKSSFSFRKHKPNFKNMKIGVSSFKTSKYEIFPAWRGENQTQFKANLTQYKANTNPIYGMAKFALSSFITSKYEKFEDSAGKKQTQTNPILRPVLSNTFLL